MAYAVFPPLTILLWRFFDRWLFDRWLFNRRLGLVFIWWWFGWLFLLGGMMARSAFNLWQMTRYHAPVNCPCCKQY